MMFGEVMLRQEPEHQIATKRKQLSAKEQRAKLREVEAKKAAFMHHFINHDVELWTNMKLDNNISDYLSCLEIFLVFS